MAEVVTVQKYKSLNGYVYDTLKDAEAADKEWKQDNEYDLEKDIAQLTKIGERDIRYLKKSDESRKFSLYPAVVVLEGKYENLYFVAKNVDQLPKIYLDILLINSNNEFYYTPNAKAISNEILRTSNYMAAYAFVKERTSYQYEKVTVEHNIKIYED